MDEAARALIGRPTAVQANRQRVFEFAPGTALLVTVHPSFLLRVPDEDRAAEFAGFVADLRFAAGFLARNP